MVAQRPNTECSLYDADNGHRVGYVKVPSNSNSRSIIVGGLYNRYFAMCYRAGQEPAGIINRVL
jgi:hypothetical protein